MTTWGRLEMLPDLLGLRRRWIAARARRRQEREWRIEWASRDAIFFAAIAAQASEAMIWVALFAIAGAGVAIRHSWLQHFPPAMETCGTDLEFLINTFPLSQALPKIFAGTGSCSKVDWTFLGLSIPEWALAWYAIFAVAALWTAFRNKNAAEAAALQGSECRLSS